MNSLFYRKLANAALLTLASGSLYAAEYSSNFQQQITFIEPQLPISVAIATNDEQRERGLMFREELASDQGMLFIFPDQKLRGVWMKNTLLSLDVLFISTDGRIVSILKNLPPCASDPCRTYGSKYPAKYMLEVNAGFIQTRDIKIGQHIQLP